MTFNVEKLTLGRGQFNNSSSSNGPAQHIYISDEPLATMIAPGYFPPYLGTAFSENESPVKINDILLVGSSLEDASSVYFIKRLDPVVLDFSNLNSFYDEYPNTPYSGASTGTLDIAFSRVGDDVTFYVLKTAALSTGSGGHFTLNLIVPERYNPDPTYNQGEPFQGSALLICATAVTAALIMNIIIKSTIEIRQLPAADFAGGVSLPLHNFSGSYRGFPLGN